MTPLPGEHDAPSTPPRRVVVMGVSGAGKSLVGSLLAQALHADFLEGDVLHPASNVAKMAAGIPLEDADRAGWLAEITQCVAQARREERALVATCSALKRRYRDVLRGGDPCIAFVHLTGTPDLIGERLGYRSGHFMPRTLLASQYEALEPPDADEHALSLDVTLPPSAIVARAMAWLTNDGEPRTR